MDPLALSDMILIVLAAVAGGAVNAIAGGGTLITFPMLTAVGIPAVAANITNTVALSPGYLGGTLAQRTDLRGQRRRLWRLLPAGAIGGIIGGLLLLASGERLFRGLVPYLILLACGLLAFQGRVRGWVAQQSGRARRAGEGGEVGWLSTLPVLGAAVYGGYFGAGLSVIVLAVLGLVVDDNLTRLNALKQGIAFAVNIAAAVFFVCSGKVVWPAAAIMAGGALVGGVLGGRLAGRVRPELLRRMVVAIGLGVALIYFLR
ncbi:sulfite exporter TauE/SafE family protein [Candidatus Fermentibacteria bacterium]|nr:sulfite exporter TauE/SafE family protein [Candidatus Fermentibacteria bacterium]